MTRRLLTYLIVGVSVGLLIFYVQWGKRNQVRWFNTIDSLTIYSIDGRDLPQQLDIQYDEYFRDVPVIGKVELPKETRFKLLTAMNKGIAEGKSQAKCFWPRHGLRMVQNGVTTDFVICFQCNYMEVYQGKERKIVLTSASPKSTFNEILIESEVPVVPE